LRQPLTNQYESKGLLIDNAYLNGGSDDGGLTYANIGLSGPTPPLYFVGRLPTFFSMNVTTVGGDAIFLTAYGPSGGAGDYQTGGYAGPHDDSPVIPNELVSFRSDTGIS